MPRRGGGRPAAGRDRPHSFGEDSSCELHGTNGNLLDKIVGSGSATTAPACQQPAATVRKKRKRKKRHHGKQHAATAAKKHKKRCHKKKEEAVAPDLKAFRL